MYNYFYDKYKKSNDFINFKRNLSIAQGDSVSVFANYVKSRVKLEYLGLINSRGLIRNFMGGTTSTKMEDLIVGDNILQDVVSLYSEKASSKKLELVNFVLGEEEQIRNLLSKTVFTSSYGGSCLIKGVYDESREFSTYIIKRNEFFEVYNDRNPGIIDKFVVFSENKDLIECEIYSKGMTEYRMFDKEFNEVPYGRVLEGMKEDGMGYINQYEGWQVGYVRSFSTYNKDLISNVKEIILQDTTTSQAFSKVIKPILTAPVDSFEIDDRGNKTLNITDGVVQLYSDINGNTGKIEQIELSTKTMEWVEQRKGIMEKVYRATKTNANVFGLNNEGNGDASGYAKELSMESLITLVETKRNEVINAIKQVYEWGHNMYLGTSPELDILTQKIVGQSEEADLANANSLADILIKLDKYSSDVEIQNMLNDKKEELLNKLRGR